jgi:hypothetical protein
MLPTNSDERRMLFALRVKINEKIGLLRTHYGNKNGISAGGAMRRYDNPQWQEIDDLLLEAVAIMFKAEELVDKIDLTPTNP